MLKRMLKSKLLVLFLSLFIIGFFTGYAYSVGSLNVKTISTEIFDSVFYIFYGK